MSNPSVQTRQVRYLKLNYFELLSPDPVYIENVGGILSPKLKDISSIGIKVYQYYLSLLLTEFDVFESLSSNPEMVVLMQNTLNFFIKEDVSFSARDNCFIVQTDGKPIGAITKDNYSTICDIICQRNSMKSKQPEDLSQVKNKKAAAIMEKLQKGRAEKSKRTTVDRNMELGNIISAVANKSQSLNILNIWDLTVFQVWDCFSRLSNNNIYAIQSMSVAAYGNKDNHFDFNSWFKKIHEDN